MPSAAVRASISAGSGCLWRRTSRIQSASMPVRLAISAVPSSVLPTSSAKRSVMANASIPLEHPFPMFKPINQSLIILEQVYLPPLSPHKESIMTHPTQDSFTTPSELDPVMDALFAFNRYYQELWSGAKDELP